MTDPCSRLLTMSISRRSLVHAAGRGGRAGLDAGGVRARTIASPRLFRPAKLAPVPEFPAREVPLPHALARPRRPILFRLRHPERRLPRPADVSVMRGQRQPAGAGCGHDESIGRILVKGRRQAIHLRDDGGRDGDHLDRGR